MPDLGIPMVRGDIADSAVSLRFALQTLGKSRSGHDLEPIDGDSLDKLLVSFEERRRRVDVFGPLAWEARDHCHADADVSLVRIGEELARESEIHSFRHAIEDALASRFKTGREPDHAGGASTTQSVQRKAIFTP